MSIRMPPPPARALILTLLTVAGATVPLRGQDHFASIRGVVIDQAAAGITGVEVRATPEATHDARLVRTDRRGRFVVPNLPPGTYRVEVEQPGFGPFVARMELATNQEFRLEIPLQEGTVLQALDLAAPFSPVDRSSGALDTFIDARQMTGAPLLGRDPLALARLAPGVVAVRPDQPLTAADDLALAVNGARPGSNAYYIDGILAVDPLSGAPAVRPPADGIREMQILTSSYDASFGRFAGGQISVVTRSGGNRAGGSLYGVFGGRPLGGRGYFDPTTGPAPLYEARQLGGSAGGALVRDRLFYFADYERAHRREEAFSRRGLVASGHDDDRADGRLDYTVNAGARLTSRYSLDRRATPDSQETLIAWPGPLRRRGQHAGASFVHAPSAALANEVRAGYNRVTADPAEDPGSFVGPFGSRRLGESVEVSDTATWTRGTHQIRFGGAWSAARLRETWPGPVAARDDAADDLRAPAWSLFAQENWRASEALTLTAGLRYELFAPAVDAHDRASLYDPAAGTLVRVGTNGVPRGGYATDRNNLAPRAGFSWAFDRERQNLLRGGYGVYYDQPWPGAALTPLFGIVPAPAATTWQRDFRTPWTAQWNLDVQHEIGHTRSLEAGYAGSRGHDLPAVRDLNPAAGVGSPRPNPSYAGILMIESGAVSRYDGLQVRYQERPVHGMSLLMSYTLGRSRDASAFDMGGAPSWYASGIVPGPEPGRSASDARHRFAAAILRPLPVGVGQSLFGNLGWLSAALSNMELAAVVTVQSGRPSTIVIDRALTRGWWYPARPDVTGSTDVKIPGPERWFNTDAYSLPAPATMGNSGRNTIEGPGYANVDAALVKRLFFLQQGTLELRLDAFNVFNRPNFGMPDTAFGSGTFGRVLSTGSPRRVHLGLRAEF